MDKLDWMKPEIENEIRDVIDQAIDAVEKAPTWPHRGIASHATEQILEIIDRVARKQVSSARDTDFWNSGGISWND